MFGFKLNKYIDIAVIAKVASQYRTKEGEFRDVMFPSEAGNLLFVNVKRKLHISLAPRHYVLNIA
jgi:hypothetical protein